MGKIQIIVEATKKAALGLAYRKRLLFPTAWEERERIWGCTARRLTVLLVDSITIFSLYMSISPPFCTWSSELKSILTQSKYLNSIAVTTPDQEIKGTTKIYLKGLRTNTNVIVQSLSIQNLKLQFAKAYFLENSAICKEKWRSASF